MPVAIQSFYFFSLLLTLFFMITIPSKWGTMANPRYFDLIAPEQKKIIRTKSGQTGPLLRASQHLNRTLRTNVCHLSCTTIFRLVLSPLIKKRVCHGCGPAFRNPSLLLRTPTQTPTNPTIKPNISMLLLLLPLILSS